MQNAVVVKTKPAAALASFRNQIFCAKNIELTDSIDVRTLVYTEKASTASSNDGVSRQRHKEGLAL